MVYSDFMKLRLLKETVKADFIEASKSSIAIELNKVPVTMTFEGSLKTFQDVVNEKFPPTATSTSGSSRRGSCNINSTNSYQGSG